jgi:hypothetical protein
MTEVSTNQNVVVEANFLKRWICMDSPSVDRDEPKRVAEELGEVFREDQEQRSALLHRPEQRGTQGRTGEGVLRHHLP